MRSLYERVEEHVLVGVASIFRGDQLLGARWSKNPAKSYQVTSCASKSTSSVSVAFLGDAISVVWDSLEDLGSASLPKESTEQGPSPKSPRK